MITKEELSNGIIECAKAHKERLSEEMTRVDKYIKELKALKKILKNLKIDNCEQGIDKKEGITPFILTRELLNNIRDGKGKDIRGSMIDTLRDKIKKLEDDKINIEKLEKEKEVIEVKKRYTILFDNCEDLLKAGEYFSVTEQLELTDIYNYAHSLEKSQLLAEHSNANSELSQYNGQRNSLNPILAPNSEQTTIETKYKNDKCCLIM